MRPSGEESSASVGAPYSPSGDERLTVKRMDASARGRRAYRSAKRVCLAALLMCVAAATLFFQPSASRVGPVAKAANPSSGSFAQTGPVLPFTGT